MEFSQRSNEHFGYNLDWLYHSLFWEVGNVSSDDPEMTPLNSPSPPDEPGAGVQCLGVSLEPHPSQGCCS